MKLTKFNFFFVNQRHSIQSWIHSTKTAFFKSGSDGIFFIEKFVFYLTQKRNFLI